MSETHYYPFGLAMNGAWYKDATTFATKYLYNGKELNDEFGLNLNDYGARWYDASIGRWWNVDPLAEATESKNPYHYVSNNLANATDPTGMAEQRGADGITNEQWVNATRGADGRQNDNIRAASDGNIASDRERQSTTGQSRDVESSDIAGSYTLEPYGFYTAARNVVEGYNLVSCGCGGIGEPPCPSVAERLSNFNSSLTFGQNFFATHIGLPLGVLELNRAAELAKLNKLNQYDFMKPAYQRTTLNPRLVGSLASKGKWASGLSTFGKVAGRGFALYGAATTFSDYYVGRKSGLRAFSDLTMTYVGAAGGPWGLAASAVYFIGTTGYDYYYPTTIQTK